MLSTRTLRRIQNFLFLGIWDFIFQRFLSEIDNMFSIDDTKISAGQRCMRREGVFCESYLQVVVMTTNIPFTKLEASWNVMAHAQKPDIFFRRNGRVYLNRRGRQFSWLLAAEVCTSAVIILDTTCSVVVWRVLATHSIRTFPLHFPSLASPCVITFQLESTKG